MGPGRQPRVSARPGAHKSLSLPGPQVPHWTKDPSGLRVCFYAPALASLRVQCLVFSRGAGPLALGKFSKAAVAQRVSDTPWREARLGLVKHDPLAEFLSFPHSPPARLPLLPLWP